MSVDSEVSAQENDPSRSSRWWLAVAGLMIMLLGAFLALQVRTAGGIEVSDIRFEGADGTEMSALLYVPERATVETPAPGILAVHGYINSRETQDGFAIEFARRGYVVLAVDQTGHGYSGGAAFSNGFGGPDGLAYLRSLPMVDTDQIGLEGHSMGGWTVLAAAAAMPNAYRSMVLQGSSTGAPFARNGSPVWPRNLALVFAQYDEFSQVMWEVDRAQDVADSPKLQSLFGIEDRVVKGQIYGSIADGTARVLHQPVTTHPGNHFSRSSIGAATEWFEKTLEGGTPLPASNQTWFWKEFGTGMGLIGFVMFVLGVFDVLLRLSVFAPLRADGVPAQDQRDRLWWRRITLGAVIPALLFFPAFIAIYLLVPATTLFPQMVTNQVLFWALLCAGANLLIGRFAKRPETIKAGADWPRSILLAVAVAAIGYTALGFIHWAFQTDIRLWIVAAKFPGPKQWAIAAIYAVPLTLAFLVTVRSVTTMTIAHENKLARYSFAASGLMGGLLVMLIIVYGLFFVTGRLVTAFDPLSTVIALQFVPVLSALAVIAIFTWQRTNSHRAGGVLAGILVTLYVVAGTATQA